jgi:hypothetical protein
MTLLLTEAAICHALGWIEFSLALSIVFAIIIAAIALAWKLKRHISIK